MASDNDAMELIVLAKNIRERRRLRPHGSPAIAAALRGMCARARPRKEGASCQPPLQLRGLERLASLVGPDVRPSDHPP